MDPTRVRPRGPPGTHSWRARAAAQAGRGRAAPALLLPVPAAPSPPVPVPAALSPLLPVLTAPRPRCSTLGTATTAADQLGTEPSSLASQGREMGEEQRGRRYFPIGVCADDQNPFLCTQAQTSPHSTAAFLVCVISRAC